MVQGGSIIRTLEELKGRTLEDLLREVARSRQAIRVVLGGESVTIEPASRLKPLPLLEGRVPEGGRIPSIEGGTCYSTPASSPSGRPPDDCFDITYDTLEFSNKDDAGLSRG